MTPTLELVLQRVHPEDAALVQQTIERAEQDGKDFDHEYRLVMPDSFLKYVHVVAHALRDESAGIEFVGAVMDVTAAKQAEKGAQGERGVPSRSAKAHSYRECRLAGSRKKGRESLRGMVSHIWL